MDLDAVVTQGRLPWSPSADAVDLDVWYEYEYPRIGSFRTKECTVLFAAVGGFETRASVWAYACLKPEEASTFAALIFDTLPDLRQFIEKEFTDRPLVFALADDLVIKNWAVTEAPGPLYEVATAFLEGVMAQTRYRQDSATKFRATLAQVDVATHELIES
jgi:hypothetical protein